MLTDGYKMYFKNLLLTVSRNVFTYVPIVSKKDKFCDVVHNNGKYVRLPKSIDFTCNAKVVFLYF